MAIRKDQDEVQGKGMGELLTAQQPQAQQEGQPQPQQEPEVKQITTPSRISSAQPTQETQPMPKQQKAGTGGFANLKKYLEAAKGGGQQRVAQAAGQQVQKLGAEAQKGITQAKETFGKRMQAGSGAFYQGATTDEAAQQAAQQAVAGVVGAARGVTYQEPQAGQTQQYLTPAQEQQFAQAISAAYQGPQSLQEAGLYQQAAEKARSAEEAAKQTQTALGRQELLRNVFGRTRDYTRGASALDALLLNTSGEAVKQLQEQAQPGLEAAKALQVEQNLSANEAARRALALGNIQKQAREAFTGARTEEEKAVEERLNKVQQNWSKLPEYFKNLLKSRKKGQKLSAEEAKILGLREGQSLFGLDETAIQQAQMEKAKVVTKDEVARQLALQRLANLDVTNALKKDLMYGDLQKAGTQNILQSIDLGKLSATLSEKEKDALKKAALKNANLITTFGGQHLVPITKEQNLLDIIKKYGKYTTMTDPNAPLQEGGIDYLKSIAEGKAYLPEKSKEKDIIDKAIESYKKTISLPWAAPSVISKGYFEKQIEENLKNQLIDPLKKLGFADAVEFTENAQTKARANALRKLLGEIY